MKKKLGNILIFILIIGLTIGYGIYKDDQSRVTVNKIYTSQFQEQALSDLENEKGRLNRYIGDMLIYSTLMMSI